MIRKVRKPGTTTSKEPTSQPPRNQLTLYRDVLDAILKTGAIALTIPAIVLYSCLRLIGHTELFSASVLSLAGLSGFLQAVLLVWLAFVICLVAPSGIIYMFLGGSSGRRPAKGLPQFVLLSSFVWAAFYAIAFEFWDNGLNGPLYWPITWGCVLVCTLLLGRLAWKSPRRMVVVPHDNGEAYFQWPSSLITLANKSKVTAKLSLFIRSRRRWQCLGVTTVVVAAGFYSLQAILAVYSFAHAYQLSEHGWRAAATLFVINLASLWPAAIYLKARVSGASHGSATSTAFAFIGALIVVGLLNGFSPLPLALGTMSAMGIIDNTPRTYEVVKTDERPVYQALGYTQKAGDRFVEAFIRFQFGDVKLVCPKKYDLADMHASANKNSNTSSKTLTPSEASEDTKRIADSAGCLTPTRDEIRVVDLPNDFSFPPKSPAAKPNKLGVPESSPTPRVTSKQTNPRNGTPKPQQLGVSAARHRTLGCPIMFRG
ncbi:hypothetical protein [Burkholderia lata]|uniref:Uncharacterized protein n=1 Tax=Burkholderia lata (strain ATCC 17760 / DSM 23089 / LMG 22485 / NCIMB 9086 / R18194 / 383) TaxID=482957 RepID=A0A6P2R6U7_BURL3|nr:hypothetical protein [Burkholderia lata]VWC28545.1 hypothetical protein BLA15945_06307 [Burkholderia lata]